MWFKLASATFTTHLGKMSELSNTVRVNLDASGFTVAGDALSFSKTESNQSRTYTLTLKSNYEIQNTVTPTVNSGNATATISGGTGGVYTLVVTAATAPTSEVKVTVSGAVYVGTDLPDVPDPEEPDNPPSGGDTPTVYYFKNQTNIGYLRGGQYIEAANSATTDYIDISSKPKIGYYGRMGYVNGDTFHSLEFYDVNKTYISSLSVPGTGSPNYVNLDLSESKYANAKYVRASVAKSSYSTEEFNKWYFIVGGEASEGTQPSNPDTSNGTVTDYFPTLGYIGLDGAPVEAPSNAYRTDYISLTGKSSINYKGRMGTIGLNLAFYDSNKTLIDSLKVVGDGNFNELTINLGDSKYSNAKYVMASVSKGTSSDAVW